VFDTEKMKAIGILLARSAQRLAMAQDTAANEVIDLAPLLKAWTPGVKRSGMVEVFGGCPYRVIEDHDSTGDESWNPEVNSCYAPWHGTDEEHALPYVAPTGAQDAYMQGEWMEFEGARWRCLADGTMHDPGVLPGAWDRS